jgi:hypothetical protein
MTERDKSVAVPAANDLRWALLQITQLDVRYNTIGTAMLMAQTALEKYAAHQQHAQDGEAVDPTIKLIRDAAGIIGTGSVTGRPSKDALMRMARAGAADEREAFEAWARSHDIDLSQVQQDGEWVYSYLRTANAWQVWQASCSLPRQPLTVEQIERHWHKHCHAIGPIAIQDLNFARAIERHITGGQS